MTLSDQDSGANHGVVLRLHPEDIARIATRVAALLNGQGSLSPPGRVGPSAHLQTQQPVGAAAGRLADAAAVARMLGVERDWVYAHAEQLGAIRLGGSKGRLRFDLAALGERLERFDSSPAMQPRIQGQEGSGAGQQAAHRRLRSAPPKIGRATRPRPRPDRGKRGPDA